MRRTGILIALVLLPLAEIWLVFMLASYFGWLPVLTAMVLFFGFGVAMMRRASRSWRLAIERAQSDESFARSGFGSAMGDAGLIFTGGGLMMLPGFITGVLGLLMVFPPVRRSVSRMLGGRVEKYATARGGQQITVIEGETVVTEHASGAHTGGPAAGSDQEPRVIIGEIAPAGERGVGADRSPEPGR